MSMSSISQVFEPGLARPRTHLDAVIREHIQATAHKISLDLERCADVNPQSPGGALTELGDYFTRTAHFWAALTSNLVDGESIQSTIQRVNTELHEAAANDKLMGDLSLTAAADVQCERLRKMRDLSQRYCQEMQTLWEPRPRVEPSPYVTHLTAPLDEFKIPLLRAAPSSTSPKVEIDPSGLAAHMVKRESSQHPISPPTRSLSESEESSDDDDQFNHVDMQALKQRGKGVYYCPKAHRCDKGGVDMNGNLVQFDRNSSFAQHCNKHRKPWRCDLPGCPNPPKKRKFARRDGLERHKQTVKHHVAT